MTRISVIGIPNDPGEPMIDISEPEREVEVIFARKTLWVNIDGACRLRVCRIPDGVRKVLNVTEKGRYLYEADE